MKHPDNRPLTEVELSLYDRATDCLFAMLFFLGVAVGCLLLTVWVPLLLGEFAVAALYTAAVLMVALVLVALVDYLGAINLYVQQVVYEDTKAAQSPPDPLPEDVVP